MDNDTIIFPGYCVPGTNGYKVQNGEAIIIDGEYWVIPAQVYRFDFSGHSGRSDLFRLITELSPRRIYVVHGDNTEKFAAELKDTGFDAIAPKLGEEY